MMKYFRLNGNVHAYEADGSQDSFIPAEAVRMSEAEVSAHLNPPPPLQALADQAPVSHAQMAAALAMSSIITDVEAIGWINGTLPTKITAAIATLPEEQRLIATLRASRPSVVDPSDSIVSMLAAEEVKTEAEMVALFQLAASL